MPEVSCEDLGRFARGEFDQSPDLFGIPKLEWSRPMAMELVDRSDWCSNAIQAKLMSQHRLTPEQLVALANWPKTVTQKAVNFAIEMDHAREQAQRAREQTAQEEQRAKARAQQALAEEQKRQHDACRETREFKRYAATEDVVEAVESLAAVKHDQEHERRVSRESGVRNLSEEYENGSRMVAAQDDLRSAWAEYKAEGGKAASPQKVQRLPDPCGAAATPP